MALTAGRKLRPGGSQPHTRPAVLVVDEFHPGVFEGAGEQFLTGEVRQQYGGNAGAQNRRRGPTAAVVQDTARPREERRRGRRRPA